MLPCWTESCFVDWQLVRYYILALYIYNLTMMMEYIFRFLPSYFSTIFLAIGKINKSITLFLSHIGPKGCYSIRLQDFKSNIPLQQSDEITVLHVDIYRELRVDRKILGCVWSEMIVSTLVTIWDYFLHADANSGKLRISLTIFGWL